MAVRIQRKRAKGWKAPEDAVYVGRPTQFGNPFKVGIWYAKGDPYGNQEPPPRQKGLIFGEVQYGNRKPFRAYTASLTKPRSKKFVQISTIAEAVEWYRWYIRSIDSNGTRVKEALGGKNLMCWCPLDRPCHADVLLEIANTELQGKKTG